MDKMKTNKDTKQAGQNYKQETASELGLNKNVAAGKTPKSYQQEAAAEFGGNTASVPTGYTQPNKMKQEAATELDVNKVMKAGKENTKKNS